MFLDIFINLLSDICFITFTTIFLLLIFFAKHSNFFHKFRSLINPESRVVVYKNNIDFNKINFCKIKTSFRQVVSNTDKKLIIENYKKRNNKAKFFDGENVRLESITNDNIELSKVNFFDFVSTNLALHPSNITVSKGNFITNNLNLWRGKDLYKNLNSEYKKYGKIVTFDEAINCKVLANIITVSILVIDKNKKLGIVKRSTNVSVSSGIFSTTSAGSVSTEDLNESNPILNCVKRELKEELNISAKEINFDNIVISKQKMQPAFLFTVKLNKSWEEIYKNITNAEDFYEIENLYIVKEDKACHFISQSNFTDVSAYQIYSYLKKRKQNKYYNFYKFIPMNKNKYKLTK